MNRYCGSGGGAHGWRRRRDDTSGEHHQAGSACEIPDCTGKEEIFHGGVVTPGG